jgi:cytochrome P450
MTIWLERMIRGLPMPEVMMDGRTTLAASAATFAVALGTAWYAYRLRNRKQEPWKMIPGRYPVLGHVPLIPSMDEIVDVFEGWATKYGTENGTYVIDMAGAKYVMICSQERAEEVLKHRPMVAQRSHQLDEGVNSLGGTGVFSAEGEQWKQERKLVSAALNQKAVQDYLPVLRSMAERLVGKWKNETQAILIDNDLKAISAESIAKVSLDRDYDFLYQPDHPVQKDIDTIMDAFNHRAFASFPYWRIPFIGQYLDGKGWAIRRFAGVMDAVVKEYESLFSRRAASRTESAPDEAPSRRTFLQKLFEVMLSENSSLPRQRVMGNVMTLFLAGTDTTSKALLTAYYLLAKDQQLQRKLREEADKVDIDELDVNALFLKVPRIKSFLHEVHRCYAAPFIGLEITKPIPFCSSTLPKGSIVLILSRYINQSNSDVPKGSNQSPPSNFDAERWLVASTPGTNVAETGSANVTCPTPGKGFVFPGFGFGVRSCPGKLYSEALSLLVLIKTVQDLEFRLPVDHPEAKFIFSVNVIPDCGVTLSFSSRRKADK